MLSEFVLPDAPVVFPAADGQRTMTFGELLPHAFAMKLK
jgi:cytidine deaminase